MSSRYFLFIALLIGAILRFYRLDYQSLWSDELYTWIECWNPHLQSGFFHYVGSELSPPIYFLIQMFVARFVEATEWSLRFLSATAGTISLLAIYSLGKKLHSSFVGVLASTLLATSYASVSYSQEARPYSLMILFTILTIWIWSDWMDASRNRKLDFLFFISGSALINTHIFGAFLLISLAVAHFLLNPNREHLRKKGCWYVATLATLLPWILIKLHFGLFRLDWIQIPRLWEVPLLYKELWDSIFLAVTTAAISLFVFLKQRSFKENRLIILLFLPSFIGWLASFYSPMLLPRYNLVALPPAILLCSIGVDLIFQKIKSLGILVAVILVGIQLHWLFIEKDYFSSPSKQQLRELSLSSIDYLKENSDTAILIQHTGENILSFYLQTKLLPQERSFEIVSAQLPLVSEWPKELKAFRKILFISATPWESTELSTALQGTFEVERTIEYYLAKSFILKRRSEEIP